jgi:tagaturonate reductase
MKPIDELKIMSMRLSKKTLKEISPKEGLIIPDEKLFVLPEKVLQFGTGVLLRGLPDYFIDKANRQGIFNGRVVVVKSTSTGGTDAFANQDGLYTMCVKGIEDNKKSEETIINASISRVLTAADEWNEILACAHNADMKIIISNTTEVGIVLTDDDIHSSPPSSFPGKLLAFLYERYKAFGGSEESGMVIIPTELIIDNGSKLQSIVLELAAKNKLDNNFINWLQTSNHFCNSLVDRIVPGKLPAGDQKKAEEKFGYTDDLMIMAEVFRLWVIESDNEQVKEILSFYKADKGVVITPGIEKFRELKLRVLNGTHTFACGLAYLAGFETVKEAMADEVMSSYIRRLAILEIAAAMDDEVVTYNEACLFANTVMDRFRNPFIDHQWLSITMNFTSKMKLRNIPLLLRHYNKTEKVPEQMAFGFAAYILFMKCEAGKEGKYYGKRNGVDYAVQDDMAGYFSQKWSGQDTSKLVTDVLADKNLWGADLSVLKGFAEAVNENLKMLQQSDILSAIESRHLKKTIA